MTTRHHIKALSAICVIKILSLPCIRNKILINFIKFVVYCISLLKVNNLNDQLSSN